jgi:transposase
MVEAVRAGKSMRSVARRFNVTLPTVQRRVKRAQGLDLDAVDRTATFRFWVELRHKRL